MTATNEPAPVAAASAGDGGSASDLAPPPGSEASIALRDLDERCAQTEAMMLNLRDRLQGKVEGVRLIRSYIAEALRGVS